MSILIDLISAEVSDGVSYNGGSEYVKTVSARCFETLPRGSIHVLRTRTGVLEPTFDAYVHASVPPENIHFIDDWQYMRDIVQAHSIRLFVVGIFQRYRDRLSFFSNPAPGLRIICVVHDLVEFEANAGLEQIYFARMASVRSHLAMVKLILLSRVKQITIQERSRKLFQQMNCGFNTLWITPSEHTKAALTIHLRADSERIQVLWSPPSPNQRLFTSDSSSDRPDTGAYLILGANRWSKNLLCVLRAGRILERIGHRFRLIAVGHFEGMPVSTVLARTSWVETHPYGPPDSIRQWILASRALLFPTLCEGFGYPPLEAMCLQRPTIASANSSVPEITGEAAMYFNPRSPMQLAHRILSLDRNRGLLPLGPALKRVALERISRQERDFHRLITIIGSCVPDTQLTTA